MVTVDQELGTLPHGDVLIEGDRIIDVGRQIDCEDAELVDGSGRIVLPGFVDAHRHIWQNALRGVTADWSLLDYMGGIRLGSAADFAPEDIHSAVVAGSLEALNAGVTTVADYSHNLLSNDHVDAALDALRVSGVRCLWSFGFARPPAHCGGFESMSAQIERFRDIAAKGLGGEGLLTLGVAPEELGLWAGDAEGQSQFAAARDVGARLTLHCNVVAALGPPREVQLLDRLKLLGPDLTLVHMHFTAEDEWSRVSDMGCSVVSTPETEMQMGMGWPVTAIARTRGLAFGLGTDIASNNSADMFFPMRLALQTARGLDNQRRAEGLHHGVTMGCAEALRWATLSGAEALGMAGKIGSLTPGKQADIVVLRTDTLGLAGWPGCEPEALIVQQANVADVERVMVAGRDIKREGRILLDTTRVVAEVQASASRLAERAAARGGFRRDPAETLSKAMRLAEQVAALKASV